MAGKVAQTGEPLIIDDYPHWAGRAAVYQDEPFSAILSVPMRWRDQVTGVIHMLTDNRQRRFNQSDLKLLTLFAHQAAIAVENAHLLDAERAARTRAEILSTANAALTQTLDLDAVLNTLLKYLQALVPYDSASVFLLEDKSRFVACASRGYERFGDPAFIRETSFEIQADWIGHPLFEGKSVLVGDTQAASGWEYRASGAHVRNWLAVPLIAGGKIIGHYSIDKVTPHFFTQEHVSLAEALAGQAATAIQNARLLEQVQQHARYHVLLNEITRAAIETMDLKAMLQVLADRLGELFQADGCYITFWDAASQRTIPMAAYGSLREIYPTIIPQPGEITMTEHILRAGHPLVADDVFHSPYVSPRIAARFPSRSLLGLPLIAGGEKLGALLVAFDRPHRFTPGEIARGEQAAAQISLAVANARAFETAQQLAISDPLTGVYNRRHLVQEGDREILRAVRFQHPLAAIMLDMDHFKSVNDAHGHPVGDEILCGVATRLRECLREVDVLARYGGEEFVILLPETNGDAASLVAERLRRIIAAAPFETKAGAIAVTLSLGVAHLDEHTATLAQLLDRADRAMYRAKEAGRNCVERA